MMTAAAVVTGGASGVVSILTTLWRLPFLRARARPRWPQPARRSMRTCARSSRGISIRRPAVRSGSTTRRSSAGIRGARSQSFADLEALRPVRGRVAARRTGAALGAARPRGQAGVRLRNRRHHRHPEDAHRVRRLPHRLRAVQRDAARRVLSEGRELADARPVGSAAAAPGGRAPGAVSRRHLLLRRSRSALGHQADQEGLERAPAGLQGPRHRPGGDDPRGRPRHPLHVHDAEAARGAGAAARVDGHAASARPASPASSPAAPSSRRSGTASRTKSCSTAPT